MKRCKRCKGKKPLCSTCRSRKTRSADLVRYSYIALRNNAIRRKKIFTITLAYFRKFCRRTNYIGLKGRNSESYTVDCIKSYLGYVPGNIRALPNGANVKKYFSYDWKEQVVYRLANEINEVEDLPF